MQKFPNELFTNSIPFLAFSLLCQARIRFYIGRGENYGKILKFILRKYKNKKGLNKLKQGRE